MSTESDRSKKAAGDSESGKARPPTPSRVDDGWDEAPSDAAVPAGPSPAKTLALGTDAASEAREGKRKPPPPPKSKPTRPPPPPLRPTKKTKTIMGPFADAKNGPSPSQAPPRVSDAPKPSQPTRAGLTTPDGTRRSTTPPPLPPAQTIPDPPKLSLVEELEQRIGRLSKSDPVGAAWATLEKGLYLERWSADPSGAIAAYNSARLRCSTIRGIFGRLRRNLTKPTDQEKALEACHAEIDLAGDDAARADLLVEAATHAEALGRTPEARKLYERALSLVGAHPAALRGLEVSLRGGRDHASTSTAGATLASHLERVAELVGPHQEGDGGDPRLAAWLWVERAELLDRKLRQPEQAEASLTRAVSLLAPGATGGPDPIRHALTHHLLRHGRTAELVKALAAESEAEHDDKRAARLLYAAGRVAQGLGQNADAVVLLERAVARAPKPGITGPRAYAELIRLHEDNGEDALAAEMLRARLETFDDPEKLAHEHAKLSRTFARIGEIESAVWHAEKALGHAPHDDATREHLDGCLEKLGKHDRRVEWFLYASKQDRSPRFRADALLRAAEIADQHLGDRQSAIGHLETAWTVDEGHPRVFQMLAGLLAAPPLDPDSPQAGPRGVRKRLDLYTRAAAAQALEPRRIALLEKILSIWEDELNQPARAIEIADRILALDPGRHTTLLALGRCALRAGDWKKFVTALTAEAELIGSTQPSSPQSAGAQRALWLRAAEVAAEALGDGDRALTLVERALATDAKDLDALRMKSRVSLARGHHADARKALIAQIEAAPPVGKGDPSSEEIFRLWLEVARIDELFLKRPADAVGAYDQAGKLCPERAIVAEEVARLLAHTGDYKRLAAVLTTFAKRATKPERRAELLFTAAEIQEARLGDDAGAVRSLLDADEALSVESSAADGVEPHPEVADRDLSALESAERIHARLDDLGALADLYRRWLECPLPLVTQQQLRLLLAITLAQTSDGVAEAIRVVTDLLAASPDHVPAQRLLEQLYRAERRAPELCDILERQVETLRSKIARQGVLWELSTIAEAKPQDRIRHLRELVREAPTDRLAWEHLARVAAIQLSAAPRSDDTVSDEASDAAIAARDLITALDALAERSDDPRERAAYQLELGLVLERAAERGLAESLGSGDPEAPLRKALASYRSALGGWPDSVVAARGTQRLAAKLSDSDAALSAELGLAEIAFAKDEQAAHLCRAAALVASSDGERAAGYLERALELDPDCEEAATQLPVHLAGDAQRVADRYQRALEQATAKPQRRRLGQHLAQLSLDPLKNPGLGVTAMRAILQDDPADGPSMMLLARLLSADGAWVEARDTLNKVAWPTTDRPAKDATETRLRLAAHLELARLYMGSIEDPGAARKELDAMLAIEPRHRGGLELMLSLSAKTADRELAARSLGVLVDEETDPAARVELDLRLAEHLRQLGDSEGVIDALCDAVVTMPKETRAYKLLTEMHRRDTREGAEAFGNALHKLIDLATSRKVPIESTWISTLGLLEATILQQHENGLARLQQAASALGAPPDASVALARGLSGVGRNAEAIQVLRDGLLSQPDAWSRLQDVKGAVEFWEATLATEGRAEERLVVEDLRAALGISGSERAGWLRKRALVPRAPYADVFAGGELAQLLVPEARSPAVDVRQAFAPMAAKAVRFDLSSLSVSSRERVGPRDNHPIRAVADQLARSLGVQYELYVLPGWRAPARVCPGDPPALVVSAAYANLNQGELAFALGRLLGYIALGAAWIEDVSPAEVDALVIAMLRVAEPEFGLGEVSGATEDAAHLWADRARRAVGWLQKRRLDEARQLVARADDALTPVASIHRSADQIGYALAGNLVGAIDYHRRTNEEIAQAAETSKGLISHPTVSSICRYALSDEAYQARRRAGVLYLGS